MNLVNSGVAIILASFLTLASQQIQASNWEHFNGKPNQKCTPSYFLNMKPSKRLDKNHLEVQQKSIGFNSVGIIELKSAEVAMFGEGFVDIGVEHIKSEKGVDYWKECKLKSSN